LDKTPRITASQAEEILLKAGFKLIRSKGGHRIYKKANTRIVIPYHSGKILHPKIVKQIFKVVNIDME